MGSVSPSRYLLLNHWTKSNQIWWNGVSNGTFFCPAPWDPGEGPIGQIKLNIIKFQLQSQYQRFVCLLTNERYKTYQTRFSFGCLGHMPQGWDFGVLWGVGGPKKISPKIQSVWCVSYLHEWHMQPHNFLGPHPPGALGRGQKVNII